MESRIKKSYIVKDKKTQAVYGFEDWKTDYTNELGTRDNREKTTIYTDPDSHSYEFYKDIAAFLNSRENWLYLKHPSGRTKYEYTAEQYPFFCISVKNKKDGFLFYLKADQFGFSAPAGDKAEHPYDTYLRLKSREDTGYESAKANVARWIFESRSLGGAFLWPVELSRDGLWNTKLLYNVTRGGSKSDKGGSYIEDRVDLTLLEVKHVYLLYNLYKKYEGDILFKYCTHGTTNMVKWLEHFGDFKTYVEYFCFEPFCDGSLSIYDILSSNLEKGLKAVLPDNDERKRTIYGDNPIEDVSVIERMLKNVNAMILARTMKMEEIKEEQEKTVTRTYINIDYL